MTNKAYADGKGTSYTYTDGGRLATRTWERGGVTTYSYDNAGDLTGVDYSDSTPDVTYTRNRLGQVTAVSGGAGSRSFTTSEDGRPLTESYTSGMLNEVTTTYGYDGLKRRTSHSAVVGSSTLGVTYGYDGASRINSVTSGSDATSYTYAPNSSLITTVTQSHGGTPKQTTSKTYDNLNRLTQISATGSSVISSHGYTYNALNQRTEAQLQDGTKWNYGYDSLGQVTSAGRKWSDNSEVAGQQYGYAFDSIGNRTGTTVNGRTASYTANSVNQYTQRQVPGAIDILGSADAAATVTVNLGATSRKGDYFYRALSINNLLEPQYPEIRITGVLNDGGPNGEDLVSEQSGHHYLARTPEVYTFDDDGNLLSDGRWQYSWDGENRLIAMESIAAVPEGAKKKLEFSYDGQSRRLEKKVYDWNGTSYALTTTKRYLYDGWNLVAELDGSNEVKQSYVWGIDLSGVMQGAGGVGGLLAIQNTSGSYYPTYDGNGNIMKLQKAADQSEVASYQYGAFGEVVEARESEVNNPFGFSTKYQDEETGLLYYGYRFYNPESGRWINRDPIQEQGGINLYAFCQNSPVNAYDPLGEAANWHHMLPQEFATEFSRVGMNIHDAKYGWVLEADFHTGKAGLHPAWNNEWRSFFNQYQSQGRTPTAADIERQLSRMKTQFASQLANGSAAKLGYDAWKSAARKARREAIQEFITKGGKKVTKKVPVLGLLFIVEDIQAKGVAGGVANNLLDQVPYLGWAKFGYECAYGDWIPDK